MVIRKCLWYFLAYFTLHQSRTPSLFLKIYMTNDSFLEAFLDFKDKDFVQFPALEQLLLFLTRALRYSR